MKTPWHFDLLVAVPYRSKPGNMYLENFGLEFITELNIHGCN